MAKTTKALHAKSFFVPGMDSEQADKYIHDLLEGYRKQGYKPSDDQRIFSLAHTHNGEDFYFEVGKPDPYDPDNDPKAIILTIIPERAYLVSTTKRTDIMVGYTETFGVIPFADYKGTPTLDYKR